MRGEGVFLNMAAKIECEIKLRFADAASARAAVAALGGVPVAARRLQRDCLLDRPDRQLASGHSALRVRAEEHRAFVTFKGPAQASAMKRREEIETETGSAELCLAIFGRLGFSVWFRYEKYREEFQKDEAIIAVDETPVGVFVEIEGPEAVVEALAAALGRGRDAFITDSYRALYVRYCEAHGLVPEDMVFPRG